MKFIVRLQIADACSDAVAQHDLGSPLDILLGLVKTGAHLVQGHTGSFPIPWVP